MAHAMACPNLLAALQLFLGWPSLGRVGRFLVGRHEEIEGDHYEFFALAARTLSERHLLAATLALRAMDDFAQTMARSKL